MSINSEQSLTSFPTSELHSSNSLINSDADSVAAYLLFMLVPLVVSLAIAIFHERWRKKRAPDNERFLWGYFVIYDFALSLIPLGVLFSIRLRTDEGLFLISVGATLVASMLSYFALRRSRVAFILITILGLNPVVWVINAFYLGRRWNEMGEESRARRLKRSKKAQKPTTS